jgi:hypothetical protein
MNDAGNGTSGSGDTGIGGESGSKSGAGQGGGAGESGGTGANGGASNPPDLDPNADIAALTDEQKGELCDWYVSLYGGYGVTTQCGGGSSTRTPDTRDQCVGLTTFPCPVTVAEYEACNISEVPSGGCNSSDPSCDPVNCF